MNAPLPEPPPPEEILSLRCERSRNTGKAYVYFSTRGTATGKREFRYPILIAEGFPGGHTLAYLVRILEQHGLMTELRRRGYDIVVIGFDQGSDRIQKNAGVVENGIEQIQRRTREPLVVAGMSMGGLVVRYALTRMEHERRDHRTRAFFTLDTPHRGAYTSVAGQWFVHGFRDAHPELERQARLLESPANQQFVRQLLRGNAVSESPLYKSFFDELRQLGNYPRRTQRWAMASGAGDGRATLQPHELIFDWRDDECASASLWTQGEAGKPVPIAQGQWRGNPCAPLTHASACSWEAVPGGQGAHLEQLAQIASLVAGKTIESKVPRYCTVPTFSALDLDPAAGPFSVLPRSPGPRDAFHDWIFADGNLRHLDFTFEMSQWLLRKLEYFDPHDRDFLGDPYPVYARLRHTAGVSRVAPYGSWWVFREADVRQALQDKLRFTKDPPAGFAPKPRPPFDITQTMKDGPFSADPPWHTRLRSVLDPGFRAALSQAPAVALQAAKDLLSSLPASGRAELVSSYAIPLPARVLFSVLGIPGSAMEAGAGRSEREAHAQLLESWVAAIVNAHDLTQPVPVQVQGATCGMALANYFQCLLRRQPSDPPKGLVDQLILQAGTAQGLSLDEVQSSLVSITVAGYLSTTFLICTGLRHLLANPQRLPLLLNGSPQDEARLLDELLRLDAPAQIVDRVAAEDLMLSGVHIAKGDGLSLILGSANRDADAYPDPDDFDPGRDRVHAQLSFGDGIHRCLGEPLARIVAPIALRELICTLPNLRIDGLVQWQTDPYLRGPSNLPVSWG